MGDDPRANARLSVRRAMPGMINVEKSASTGITPNERVKKLIRNASVNKGCVKVQIKQLVLQGKPVGSKNLVDRPWEDKFNGLQKHLDENEPSYLAFWRDDKECLLITYIPESVKPKDKMLYASTRGALKTAISEIDPDGSIEEYNVTAPEEVEASKYSSRHNAPKAYTDYELEKMEIEELEKKEIEEREKLRKEREKKGEQMAPPVQLMGLGAAAAAIAAGKKGGRLDIKNAVKIANENAKKEQKKKAPPKAVTNPKLEEKEDEKVEEAPKVEDNEKDEKEEALAETKENAEEEEELDEPKNAEKKEEDEEEEEQEKEDEEGKDEEGKDEEEKEEVEIEVQEEIKDLKRIAKEEENEEEEKPQAEKAKEEMKKAEKAEKPKLVPPVNKAEKTEKKGSSLKKSLKNSFKFFKDKVKAQADKALAQTSKKSAGPTEDDLKKYPDDDGKHTLGELQQMVAAKKFNGVDHNKIEDNLSSREFIKTFGMDKTKFAELPEWKKKRLKTKVKLF